MHSLDYYIDQIKTLPPAPRILTELLLLLSEADVESERVVELITFDPALTAQVLQRCNSAAAGFSQPVADLPDAVMRLGFNDIYRLVAAVVAESTLGAAQRGYGIGPGELWQHSAVAAVAAKVIARSRNGEENVAFTAALLHDIGKLILSSSLEGAYDTVIKATEVSGHSFLEAEKAILGVQHAEVGGRLLERWSFPEQMVRAVWLHHDPVRAHPFEHLAASVHVSDMISHSLGYGHGHQAYAVRGQAAALEILGFGGRDMESLMLRTDAALNETKWFTRKEP
jgi:putative nucleotidyltransferase with HDIG domain